MSHKKSHRITVSGRNLTFLQNLAAEMNESDLTEVLRYLLTDVRCLGYQIGVKPVPQQLQAPLGYSFDVSTFNSSSDSDRNHYEVPDPVIERLINAGLEMDF